MEDMIATDFFGCVPEKFYHEIYAIGYNEFLGAVSSLKTALLEEFPDKEAEVEQGCSSLLASYRHQFDHEWFARCIQYCSKNILLVPRHVPVYGEDLGKEGGCFRVEELRHQTMAVEYLNAQLRAQLEKMDKEISKRRALLVRLKQVEEKKELVFKARQLEAQIKEVVEGTY